MSQRLRGSILLIAGAMSAATATGWAETPPEAVAWEKDGAAAYEKKDYRRALEAFTRSYAIDSAPVMLFNIAQAHYQLGDYERAIHFYKRYLTEAPASGKHRQTAARNIGILERRIAGGVKPAVAVRRASVSKERARRAPKRLAETTLSPPPAPSPASPAPLRLATVTRNTDAREPLFNNHQHRATMRSKAGDHDGAIAELDAAHDLIAVPELLCAAGREKLASCAKSRADEDARISCYRGAKDYFQRCLDSSEPAAIKEDIQREIREIDSTMDSLRRERDRRRNLSQKLYLGAGVGAALASLAALGGGIAMKLRSDVLVERYETLPDDMHKDLKANLLQEIRSYDAWSGGAVATGVLLAGACGVLLWKANVSLSEPSSVAFWIAPTGSGLLVGGRF